MNRFILLLFVSISLFGIAPYFGFLSQPSLVLSKNTIKSKGIFDEIAEKAERIADIDEKAEHIRRAGEEFIDDVRDYEE